MKVNFNKDILGSAISTALSCVSTKSTIASAEGILLDCTGERAVIVGYDMEKWYPHRDLRGHNRAGRLRHKRCEPQFHN